MGRFPLALGLALGLFGDAVHAGGAPGPVTLVAGSDRGCAPAAAQT